MSHVDTNTINHVSLCSGYGGIDLGLKRAIGERLRTVAFVEIEAFAAANLAAKAEAGLLDNAPIWSDLKRFPWGKFHGLVDILSGGYPCQPFSAAGKRLGAEDPRHLWPHISARIAAMRPSVCFFENVEGHISLGLSDVIEDLAGLGYRATWCVASASECGAPHQRKRVFILAYDGNNAGAHFWSRFIDHRGSCQAAHVSPQAADQQAWRDCGEEGRKDASSNLSFSGCWSAELANPSSQRDRESQQGISLANQCLSWREEGSADAGRCLQAWPSRPGEQQFAWEPPRVVADSNLRNDVPSSSSGELREPQKSGACWQRTGQAGRRQTQSPLGRDADGPADWLDDAELYTTCDNRTDELRLLGNGVVPAVAERAFRTLVSELVGYSESQ